VADRAANDQRRRTALYERHVAAGARFTEFGGWEMPVRYGSILDEHRAVRAAAGLFDLSHMGELHVRGVEAAAALAGALVADPRRLAVERAHYSLMCAADGGIIDDLIVYRTAPDEFLVVPNAGNREVVAAELAERLRGHDVALRDASLDTSLLAIQGPNAAAILDGLGVAEAASLRTYGCAPAVVAGVDVLLARTGYTGEDGFELFAPWSDGARLWDALLEVGQARGLVPVGLGARDTLRLEAGMPLYGNELDRQTNPFEAGLGRFVHLDREPAPDGAAGFVGQDALRDAASRPQARQLVGLALRDRGIPRHGYPVQHGSDGARIGVVTSGGHSPTLDQAIAMAYVPPSAASAGTMLQIAIRDAAVPAEVVPLPFYRRPR
jgi:aminomethyltransferase